MGKTRSISLMKSVSLYKYKCVSNTVLYDSPIVVSLGVRVPVMGWCEGKNYLRRIGTGDNGHELDTRENDWNY